MKKISQYLLTASTCLFSTLSAAFPATHVIIAEKWLEQRAPLTDEETRSLLLGTLFPDIRHLGELKREDTHPVGVTVESIASATNPFEEGIFLHVFLDTERSRLIELWRIYRLLDKISPDLPKEHRASFLKLIEDEILMKDRYWIDLQRYLSVVVPEEIEAGSSLYATLRWHMILSHYFSQTPSRTLWQLAKADKGFLGIPADVAEVWSALLPIYASHPDMQAYVKDLVQSFEQAFANDR